MKRRFLTLASLLVAASAANASIWRCGEKFTTDVMIAAAYSCERVEELKAGDGMSPLWDKAAGQPRTVTRQVGGKAIVLPIPPGFVEAAGQEAIQLLSRMLPARNRLVAAFITVEADRALRAGQPASATRYFLVQVSRAAENTQLRQADFDQLRGSIKSSVPQILERSSSEGVAEVSRNLSESSMRADVASVSMNGVYLDEPYALAFLATAKLAVHDDLEQKAVHSTMLAGTSVTLLRTKPVMFLAYSEARGPEDTAWVKAQTRDWITRARAANP